MTTTTIGIRLNPEELEKLDALIAKQAIKPTRAHAARHFCLCGMGLQPTAEPGGGAGKRNREDCQDMRSGKKAKKAAKPRSSKVIAKQEELPV